MRDLSALTVVKLKELLRAQGLPVSGKKAVLIERLQTAAPFGAAPSSSSSSAAAVVPTAVKSARPSPQPFEGAEGAIFSQPTPRQRVEDTSVPLLRVGSWNVAGLRGLLRKDAGLASLRELSIVERLDVLMLQETKLQESHEAEVEPALLAALCGDDDDSDSASWRSAFASSTARKGYSGVCTLWNERTLSSDVAAAAMCAPLPVDPQSEAEREGRTLLLTLPLKPIELGLVNVYTPNAGAELSRLPYRTGAGGWDERFRAALVGPQLFGDHLCVLGDLNVAVEDLDFFNPHEARMKKQAGTTPEERASMREMLAPAGGMVDGFRHVHANADGQFTYWSQRARNRPRNRGLRIDYALVSAGLVASGALVDVQHLQHLEGSDHCPVVMTLRLDRL